MADGVFDAALGRAVQLVDDNPNALQFILLKTAQADATLQGHATIAAVLGAANTEADFTNYARKTGLTETIDSGTAGQVDLDVGDQTWSSAGGASNNTLAKLIVAVQTGGTDSTLIPLTHQDFSVTTDGTDLTAQIAADGFYRAT